MQGKKKLLLLLPVILGVGVASFAVVNNNPVKGEVVATDDDTVSRTLTGIDTVYTDEECTIVAADSRSTSAPRYTKNYYSRFEMYKGYDRGESSIGTFDLGGYFKNITPILGLTKVTVHGFYKLHIVLSDGDGHTTQTESTYLSGTTLSITADPNAEYPYRFFEVVPDKSTEGWPPTNRGFATFHWITYEYSRTACIEAGGDH